VTGGSHRKEAEHYIQVNFITRGKIPSLADRKLCRGSLLCASLLKVNTKKGGEEDRIKNTQ
jgi:hypothetical protein